MKGFPVIRELSIPAAARLVMRGDAGVTQDALRRRASEFRRQFPNWGRFGLSGLVAASDAEVDALCEEPPLERFASILVYDRALLLSFGIEVVPTFRVPHVTLAQIDLDCLIEGLLECPHY
ncbi:MAG: hypothetical protein WCP28_18510, partial [Actinomycetes bacterium]